MTRIAALLMATLFMATFPDAVLAHTGGAGISCFSSGFQHPIGGLDHILAMVAVGLWGAQLGAPAIWMLPVAFPLAMAFGGFLGLVGVPLPGVEIAIALSAVALGLAVLWGFRPPLLIAALMVGLFALFHGHAHGTELPPGTTALAYSVGFVVATGLLHLLGIAIGAAWQSSGGKILVRTAGSGIALGGLGFLTGLL